MKISSYFSKGLVFSDGLGVLVCFNAAYWLRLQSFAPGYLISWNLVWMTGIILASFYVLGLYDFSIRLRGLGMPSLTLIAVALGGVLLITVLYFGGFRDLGGLLGRSTIGGGLVLLGAWSALTRQLLIVWRRTHSAGMRWLALCEEEYLQFFWNDYRNRWDRATLACLTKKPRPEFSPDKESDPPLVGTWEEADTWLEKPWDGVIVALQTKAVPSSLIEKLMQSRLNGLPVMDLTDFYERYWNMVPVFHLHDGWFATSHGFDLLHHPIALNIKGILDKLLALTLLVLLGPLMILIAVAIRLERRGPAIFRQERAGQGGRSFTIYKFRSMVEDAESAGPQWAEKDDPRVTRVGRMLRFTRLDELPQVINVLKGNMSFIGPRPERPVFNAELEAAIPYFKLRNLLKPGITGWAQVSYAYGASVEDARIKLGYDLYYIKNYSLLLDLRIILDTIRVVLYGKGR